MNKTLYYTISVCPECLKRIPAQIVEENGEIYMNKSCNEHGMFHTLIWQDKAENYMAWLRDGGIDVDRLPSSPQAAEEELEGIGFEMEAEVQPCSSALMTTNRCNMNCPVCFTRDKAEAKYEPDIDEIDKLLDFYKSRCGEDALLELCGGEPTVREDLPEIAALAREKGFEYVQLNTNGKALAADPEFCRKLKDSGVTTVYLGFDGFDEDTFEAKYGENILKQKLAAIKNCELAGLAVVLVPCIIPGVNDNQLGEIIDLAVKNVPTVRGVYFQPVSYFGIYPKGRLDRITIPAVIRGIEKQTDGRIKETDFLPGAYEHAACSFQATYMVSSDGKLISLNRRQRREYDPKRYLGMRKNTKMIWTPGEQRLLFVGGMAFQDAGNIDLLKIRRCSVQIIGRDGKMIPLCSKYLTDSQGNKVHPGIS